MLTKGELSRRLALVEGRVDSIDQHGTRGVEAIRLIQAEQAKALGEISGQVKSINSRLDDARSSRLQRYTAVALALLPIYVLLYLAVFHVPT